jgi:tRNA-specific 2-thiouridylase
MSGGVDSSAAAYIMKAHGYECVGATMKLFDDVDGAPAPTRSCCSLVDVNDARAVAVKLGFPHYTMNFTEAFREKVIAKFIRVYEAGATPNPCIDCNRYLKFSALLQRARELDCDCIATGHYARIESSGGRFLLKKGIDAVKDQSYFLYMMTQEQLSRTVLPLGGMTKDEVRSLAHAQGFVNAKKPDSQDICFVPDGDYGAFMERSTGKRYEPGAIVGEDGAVLGRHRGLPRYTIGQRRGLGVAQGVPFYVKAKSTADNTLVMAPEASLYTKSLTAHDLNLIACDAIDKPTRVTVKTRYTQSEATAVVRQVDDDTLTADFDEPQRAVTPGQACVLYDGDTVVGGGTIAAYQAHTVGT